MRGSLMRRWTIQEHQAILGSSEDNQTAAEEYNKQDRGLVTRQLVRYWRKVFIEGKGNLSGTDNELKQTRTFITPQPDDDFGDLSITPEVANSILVIPDQHAPYQHVDTLPFLRAVKAAFKPDLVVNLGDELDYHALSFHDSDPNLDSAGAELERGRLFLAGLHKEFPEMLVCHSNHGSMVYRRAKAHGIPVQMIKRYRDIIFPEHGAPSWSWAFGWKIETPLGLVMFQHQASNVLSEAAHNGCNMVVGHNHGDFKIDYSASRTHLYYGCVSGCLIDKDHLAFAYGKHSKNKPIIGCTVILRGRPVLLPMILNEDGRWTGNL